MNARRINYARGITLAEMLVSLTILSILTTAAVPAMRSLLLDARMTAQVNGFVHAMHRALRESLMRGTDVVLCRSRDRLHCTHDGEWHEGFIVFVNRDRDDPPQVDAGETLLQIGAPFADGHIRANRTAFVFRPYSRRSVNGTFVICDRRGTASARAVIVSYTGRPRVAKATGPDVVSTCAM